MTAREEYEKRKTEYDHINTIDPDDSYAAGWMFCAYSADAALAEADEKLAKAHRPTIAQLLALEPADENLMENLREFGPERASYTELYRVTKRLQAKLAEADEKLAQAEATIERLTEQLRLCNLERRWEEHDR